MKKQRKHAAVKSINAPPVHCTRAKTPDNLKKTGINRTLLDTDKQVIDTNEMLFGINRKEIDANSSVIGIGRKEIDTN